MSEPLVKNPWADLEDKADPEVPTATLQMYESIASILSREQDTHINRASSATMCFKRRWYQRQGIEGDDLTPRKIVNFLLGDLSERVMLYFVEQGCVGPGKLYSEVAFGKKMGSISFQGKELGLYEQDDLEADLEGLKITAHADGWGKRNSDGKWELIECKSAANWGFKDFQETGPKDYLKQAMALLSTDKAKALEAKQVRFFYLRKETGHLWDRVFNFDQDLYETVVAEFHAANGEKEPPTPYPLTDEMFRRKPTGRKTCQWMCGYCPYVRKCQGDYQLEWKKDQFGYNKPVYIFGGTK